MVHNPQAWNSETLWQQLEPLLPGISVEVVDRITSTNSALIERARMVGQERHTDRRAGRPSGGANAQQAVGNASSSRRTNDLLPCLLVAEQQTQGLERMGRTWRSVRGASLTFSLALPMAESQDLSGLSLAVGVAVAQALDPGEQTPPKLQLKWPNDLWLNGRKLGGILIETVPLSDQRMVVIGLGLNVTPQAATEETAAGFSCGFACVRELMPDITAPALLTAVAPVLVRALATFQAEGFAPFTEAFKRRDALHGQAIVAGALSGTGAGLGAAGELLIDTSAGLQTVIGGEVSVRLNATHDTSSADTHHANRA